MEKTTIVIAYRFTDKKNATPFFFESIQENGSVLVGNDKVIGDENDVLFEAMAIAVESSRNARCIEIYVQESDFDIYKVNEALEAMKILPRYTIKGSMGKFIEKCNGRKVEIFSISRNKNRESDFKRIYNRHFK